MVWSGLSGTTCVWLYSVCIFLLRKFCGSVFFRKIHSFVQLPAETYGRNNLGPKKQTERRFLRSRRRPRKRWRPANPFSCLLFCFEKLCSIYLLYLCRKRALHQKEQIPFVSGSGLFFSKKNVFVFKDVLIKNWLLITQFIYSILTKHLTTTKFIFFSTKFLLFVILFSTRLKSNCYNHSTSTFHCLSKDQK